MVRLIVLNGPPGIGKSVLARRYVEDHPPALDLDIDRVRSLLGRWEEQPEQAGLLARSLALAMARTHLTAGYDVIIPQYLGRLPFLLQLETLAVETGAVLAEFLLLDERQNALRRWAAREVAAAGVLSEDEASRIGAMYDDLIAFVGQRPQAVVIGTRQGEIDAAYSALLGTLDRLPDRAEADDGQARP